MAGGPNTDDNPNRRPDGSRDFGDSAGYGSGGSTIDRREVGDSDPPKRKNPLDDVVDLGDKESS